MKRLGEIARRLLLRSDAEKLRRSDAQTLLMAQDLSKLHANYLALMKMRNEGHLAPSSLAVIRHLTILLQLRHYPQHRHGVRTAKLASIMARRMELDSAYCTMIELAAPLHDIGMLAVPRSNMMREVTKEHVLLGEAILNSDDYILSMAARIARSHHEHFDGSGYPDGLIGEEIPLEARIVAVADRFDHFLHAIDDLEAHSADAAFSQIFEQYGKQFDPIVVRALNQSMDEFLTAMVSETIQTGMPSWQPSRQEAFE